MQFKFVIKSNDEQIFGKMRISCSTEKKIAVDENFVCACGGYSD